MRWIGALLPLAMTLTIVVAGAVHAVQVGGIVREPDEGTAAHLFQLLIPAEVPIIVAFLATQLPRDRRWTLRIFAVQAAAAMALVGAVFILGL